MEGRRDEERRGGCGVTGREIQEECEIAATISSKYCVLTSSVHKQEEGAKNEEEGKKWELRVRKRCFPHECNTPKLIKTFF